MSIIDKEFIPFTLPTDNMELWLTANDASTFTLDGAGDVIQWDDKSGNSRHATVKAGASSPYYSATGFYGNPGVQFRGTDVLQCGLNINSSNMPDLTIFCVFNFSAINSGLWGHNTAGFDRETHLQNSGLGNQTVLTYGFTDALLVPANIVAQNTLYVQSYATAPDFGNAIWFNGELRGIDNIIVAATGLTTLNIGSIGTTVRLTGYISEIIAYSKVFSRTKRQQIENYLINKQPIII